MQILLKYDLSLSFVLQTVFAEYFLFALRGSALLLGFLPLVIA